MSVAQIEALYEAAVAALDAGNYDVAIVNALKVKIRLSTTPNIMRTLTGSGQTNMMWANVAAIDFFIKECKVLKATALASSSGGPFQRTKIIYDRPRNYGCYE